MEKRKVSGLLINRPFQLKFISLFAGIFIIYAIIHYLSLSYVFASFKDLQLGLSSVQQQFFYDLLDEQKAIILLISILSFFFGLFLFIFFSLEIFLFTKDIVFCSKFLSLL